MHVEAFLAVLNHIHILNNELKSDLRERIKTKTFKKNSHIHKEGSILNEIYFLHSGLVRHYHTKSDKELTIWFSQEGEFVTDSSFLKRAPCFENLQALEDCFMSYIGYGDFEALCAKHHDFEHIARIFMTNLYLELEAHYVNIMVLNAIQKYDLLLQNYPSFIKRVPLGYIASFLGMTPETLSRVRSRY